MGKDPFYTSTLFYFLLSLASPPKLPYYYLHIKLYKLMYIHTYIPYLPLSMPCELHSLCLHSYRIR